VNALPALLAASTPAFFTEVAALLVAGAAIAYLGNRFGVVPIAGFLLAGVLIGPNAAGLVRDRQLIDAAADVGVILLLFTIGIEFSLERLARIRRLILLGGGLQVGLATAATLALVTLAGRDWRVGLFTGFLVALSSTAIVLKLLGDRGETTSERGQLALALLIFQDLAIVAMVLLVPVLAGTAAGRAADLTLWALVRAVALVAAVVLLARRLMPRLLEAVARTCSPDLFLLTVIAICFGTAWLTSLAGVSLSLGAFLAGLLVSESSFSEHALSEILPLRILFNALFFVSVGMLLDPPFLLRNLPAVMLAIAAVAVIKLVTTSAALLALGCRLPLAVSSGLLLAQVGEFSFVLERAGRASGLTPAGLGEPGSQAFVATTVVLMVLTPSLARLADGLAARMERGEGAAPAPPARGEGATAGEGRFGTLRDHVIVAGFGGAARRLVTVLREANVPFGITTLSPPGAEEAEAAGHPVLRGDASRAPILERAGVRRARLVVVADDDPQMTGRVAAVARGTNARLRAFVRTRRAAEAQALREAGADVVVADEVEGAVRLSAEVLRAYGVEPAEIARHEESLRLARHDETAPAAPAASRPRATGGKPVDTERRYRLVSPPDPERCRHGDRAREVVPSAAGCEDCLASGDRWVHLRLCMTCGHVGCCDSSKNRHATKHWQATSHPIVRSLEPGEEWAWCFEDRLVL
jgi:CPA2 family monovalent cation:H+ antiporter-2